MGLLALPRFLNCPIPIQSVTATKTLSYSHYREKELSHSRGKNDRENIANTVISGYRGNNYRNIYKVPITAEKHIFHYRNPKAVSLSRVRGRFSSMRDCEGVQICSASLFFLFYLFFFSLFFLSFFYFLLVFIAVLVAHNHASQQHTTNNNTPEGRPAVMEGGANVGGVNNDVGEGGSPVVTDPSAESGAGAGAAAAAAGGGGEDDSPVLGGVVGDGTAPTQTVHSQNGTPFTVTVVPAKAGQQAKRSWICQVMHEFSPAVAGKHVRCSVCKHLLAWKARSGTSGMTKHFKTRHPTQYKAITEGDTTIAAAKAKVTQAIGEFMVEW